MSSIVRLGDFCTGHDCFPPRPNVSASPDVFSNGIPVHRLGDAWAVHCCIFCHGGVAATASANVFANGIPVCKVGDMVSCGSSMTNGSPNTWVNGD